MKKSIIQIFLFCILFFIYDKLFLLLENRNPETEIDKRLELLINGKINKDVIILGSSRGARDIIASQLESETGFSAYNLCYPGSNIEFHDFILHTLVEYNRIPKIILFVVDDYIELLPNEKSVFRSDRLYPLVKYPYIRNELITIGEKNELLSRLFVLHQLNLRNFELRKKRFSPLDTILTCGSMPISFQRNGRDWIFNSGERLYPAEKEMSDKLKAFNNCMHICKTLNIIVVIVFPPNFQAPSNSFKNRLIELSGDDAYQYIYNYNNSVYRNKDYYYDEEHLLRKGAVLFTTEVSDYLKLKFK
jgi:hypothetical protein